MIKKMQRIIRGSGAPSKDEHVVFPFIIVDLQIGRYNCVLALTDKAPGEVFFRPSSVTLSTNDHISDPGQGMTEFI